MLAAAGASIWSSYYDLLSLGRVGLGLTYALTVSALHVLKVNAVSSQFSFILKARTALVVCHCVGHQLPELGCEKPGRPGGPDVRCEEGQQFPQHRV